MACEGAAHVSLHCARLERHQRAAIEHSGVAGRTPARATLDASAPRQRAARFLRGCRYRDAQGADARERRRRDPGNAVRTQPRHRRRFTIASSNSECARHRGDPREPGTVADRELLGQLCRAPARRVGRHRARREGSKRHSPLLHDQRRGRDDRLLAHRRLRRARRSTIHSRSNIPARTRSRLHRPGEERSGGCRASAPRRVRRARSRQRGP